MKKLTIRDITFTGLMAALVFAGSKIEFIIPLSLGSEQARLHFGNVMCLLAGMVLGGVKGGLAAGIGSAFYDILNPLYITSAPFTFAFKFMMAFVCGAISRGGNSGGLNIAKNSVAAVMGSITYIILYLSKKFAEYYFVKQFELAPSLTLVGAKALTSSVNAIIAVICAVPLGIALNKALKRL